MSPVHGQVGVDGVDHVVRLVLLAVYAECACAGAASVSDGVHVVVDSDLLDLVQVDLGGVVHGRVPADKQRDTQTLRHDMYVCSKALPGEEGDQVGLVDAVENELGLVCVVVAHLAGDVSVVHGAALVEAVVARGVHRVHDVAAEP